MRRRLKLGVSWNHSPAKAVSWLMPRLGIHIASGVLSAIIVATIGAVLLLVIVRLVTGAYPRRRWRF